MKRFTLTCLLTLCAVVAFAVTKSQVVVYIDGQRYYIHTVKSKETIYSLAKEYKVDQQVIIDLNSNELKEGENIKIPFTDGSADSDNMSARKIKRTFSKHKIKSGETLYSISKRYEISIDVIMEDNPSIDPIALPLGEELLIRKKSQGKSSEEEIEAEWADYQADLNLTTDSDGYLYHIVKEGETLYSLSKEAGITTDEFVELNNLTDGLKAGSIVKIPVHFEAQTDDSAIEGDDSERELKDIILQPLRANETLKVALMLPLSSGDSVSKLFGDFYKGFEMGLNYVKSKWGRDIELTLYNTERNLEVVNQIVKSEEFAETNLIVGPVYEELLQPVIEYAEFNRVPIISPLASLKHVRSNVLFQLAPTAEQKYEKLKDIFDDSKEITLVYTQKIDTLFEANILKLIGDLPYTKHNYQYENPSIVAQRALYNAKSPGNLSPYINNNKDNVIVVMSSNETDVDRILSALSSAQLGIVGRGGKSPQYMVIGNSDWSRFKNIDRTILFKNNVTLITSYHAKRDNKAIRVFDSNHIRRYGSMPSLYTYRGFDAAIIFGEAIYSDLENSFTLRSFAPLQSMYKFKINPDNGIHTNTEWIRVNYNQDYTITIQ